MKSANNPGGGGYILGLDAGGTKTRVAVADAGGKVLASVLSGPANFQGVGVRMAARELERGIDMALEKSRVQAEDLSHAAYGIAGADREKDFDIIAAFLRPINPAGRFVLCNDTTLVLRAGTPDGVGVASVAGTGSNTMGFNAAGEHVKVGGFGGQSGDYGSAYDLGQKAVIAAIKAWDGRGPKTALSELICRALGLEEIVDIIERTYFDYEKGDAGADTFAPMVFQAANAGDKVALGILTSTGRQCAGDILTCMRRLFPDRNEGVSLVLGGSVYQKGASPVMIDALDAAVRRRYKNLKLVRLKDEPCLGALLLAMDERRGGATPQNIRDRLRASGQPNDQQA